jgi:aspartyl aminopeptidase
MQDENNGKKSLFAYERENGWKKISEEDVSKIEKYSKGYISFISEAKTEREAHDRALSDAVAAGFKNIDEYADEAGSLKAGDAIYRSYQGRTLLLARIGKKPMTEGFHIVGGHIDSPRLDLKQVPLYEDSELALLDTHYYGGIKKYQWVAIPLALHGVVVKQDGTKVNFTIGEKADDPVFTITDLLPHLGKEQVKKTLEEGIAGEGLNILVGSIPLKGSEVKSKVKENILSILHDRYGIVEEDLQSADIEAVPAGPARELGFDKSMILGYGQDDRICAYAAYKALLDLEETPEYTSIALLCDKEEIGSSGATGMDSTFFENTAAQIVFCTEKKYNDIMLRKTLENSRMLSADVNSAHDPNYPDVSAPNGNMAALNCGIVICKYTGHRGKVGGSEASAEFMGRIRTLFNKNGVFWHSAELGKVDLGGGGTIAHFMSRYGMDVIDCGPALLSMHAPWEVSSKLDAFMSYNGYKVFFADNRR